MPIKMDLTGKIKHKRRLMEYVSKYLEQIVKESTDDCNVVISPSNGRFIFESKYENKTLTYIVEKEMFFKVCKDAINEEMVKEAIDCLIVDKYYEAIVQTSK